MSTQSTHLKELFQRPGLIRLIGAHDALGAKLAEISGFDGVWASGLEISAARAVPDANILTMSEFLAAGQAMASSVSIPVVADCDTGFGNSNNVIYMVKAYEAAGVAAVCMEDKLFPKVNSFIPGRQDLASVAEFVGKIMAAKNAQRSSEFMVIARVEALIAGWGQDEALRRAHAYAAAGADAILIHDKGKTPDAIIKFARAWDFSAPLVVVPTTYYSITAQELTDLGIKMAIYANHGLRASIRSMLETYESILDTGSTAAVEDRIAPMKLVFDLQGMPQYKRDEEAFVRTHGGKMRAIIPGSGDHLNEYSMKDIAAELPMGMLDVHGRPLLMRQAEVMNQASVRDITFVAGYRREKVAVDGVKVAENPRWAETGEMVSILAGDQPENYEGKSLVAYSDILFDGDALGKLLKREEDIVLLVGRTHNQARHTASHKLDLVALVDPVVRVPTERALDSGSPARVARIGKNLPPAEADGEFTGLALFSAQGWKRLRERYAEVSHPHAQPVHDGTSAAATAPRQEPFHEAAAAARASLTDMLQELIDQGQPVYAVQVSSGWLEIHSFADYKAACAMVTR
ncbi:MAG: isocitrate lyase/phosphoenolpyruvate mutase family protein [Terriglobales bacterium]